ncbi:hypothetical protein PsorP6_011935 [Peronosclerospora sorghi]|uniref:Uncharacterized protein n=1 Tax=Peronosclerospora sorghi TaxID=230839 RepID=A0ACC0WMU5_9STRA|nr:hypothetical protein PsorP6_011935 [Peronosclerospora sorghi]
MVDSGDLWRNRNKVFVAGLPLYVDENALYEKFNSFGEMHQSKDVYDNISGRSKGLGFVTFCDYAHALDAVAQLNQTKWDKLTLNTFYAKYLTRAASYAQRLAEHIQTKEFQGFGHVQFYEEGPCEAAVQFDGMVVMGRPMKLDYDTRDEAYAQARDALQKKLKKRHMS